MSISRKKFLQLSALTSASLFVPRFLKAFDTIPGRVLQQEKILVVLQLTGGNDGLNTVIPYRNDIYYRSRPQLAIPAGLVLPMTDELGLHPALKGLKALYDKGWLSVLNGIGYPDPNRSHVRSMDIWHTASRANEQLANGWLGRYLDHRFGAGGEALHAALELHDSLSMIMKGQLHRALSLREVDQYYPAVHKPQLASASGAHSHDHDATTAGYLSRTLADPNSSASGIGDGYKQAHNAVAYPDTAIGERFRSLASMINGGADARVYYLAHGGFDTHVQQLGVQGQLLAQMDEALTAFVNDLQATNRMDQVLIVTFSEFGRRVAQNASSGTDHGTASNMLVIGKNLRAPGIYNALPSLEDLDHGDLKFHTDFKRVYATLLDKWLQTDAAAVLGPGYPSLDFI